MPEITRKDKLVQLLIASIAVIFVAITVAYYYLHLTRPVDNARLDPIQPVWQPDGIIVNPVESTSGGLRTGDLVTGVAGQSLESWAIQLFKPNTPRPIFHENEAVPYSVIRDGQPLSVEVIYKPFPLGWVLTHRWGTLFFALVAQLVGAFVFIRRPRDMAARLLFLWGFLACYTYAWSMGLVVSDILTRTSFWLYSILSPLGWTAFWCVALHFAFVFPQPKSILRRKPRLPLLIYLAGFAFLFTYLAYSWEHSASVLLFLGSWSLVGYIISLISLALMVSVLLWTYATERNPVSREKIRWAIYGTFVSGIGGLFLWLLPPILLHRQIINENLMGVMVSIFPITLAIAILRFHLFDIDLIINRTLVYGALTATLAIIYFGTIVLLQLLFHSITRENSGPAVVISTLTIAALFNPLRRRFQTAIDRRFYRHKYDVQKTLEDFAATLRNPLEFEDLSSSLLSVIEETMQPEHVSLWVKK